MWLDRRLHVVLLAILAGLFLMLSTESFDTVVDDAYITARYASVWAMGAGPTYSPDSEPVEGFTNLLWTLWQLPPHWMGWRIHPWMVWSGWVAAVLALPAAWLLTEAVVKQRTLAGVVPAAALCGLPHYAVAATNGLETSLFISATLWAMWGALEARGRARWIAGVALALLPLIRPEGIAVSLGVVLWDAVIERPDEKRPERYALGVCVVTTLIAVTVWRLSVFGAWVPNTFSAKAEGGFFHHLEGNLRYLKHDQWMWSSVAALLVLTSLLPPFRGRRWLLSLGAIGLVAVAFRVLMWMPGARLLLLPYALVAVVVGSWIATVPKWAGVPLASLVFAALVGVQQSSIASEATRYDRVHSAAPRNGAERAALALSSQLDPGEWTTMRDGGVFAYFLGPHVNVCETHDRALTWPHPDGRDSDVLKHCPVNPAIFVNTVQRKHHDTIRYRHDRFLWTRFDADYEYLGRVHQHYHRFYDVYARSDLGLTLPKDVVFNRNGPPVPPQQARRESAKQRSVNRTVTPGDGPDTSALPSAKADGPGTSSSEKSAQ